MNGETGCLLYRSHMSTLRQEFRSQSVSQSAASLQGEKESRINSRSPTVDGRESTVESAKSTVQYGNRRGTRESTESVIVNTVSVGTVCNRTIVIPTV
jgi:hypothetical protein